MKSILLGLLFSGIVNQFFLTKVEALEPIQQSSLYDLRQQKSTSLESIVDQFKPGSVVIVSEIHSNEKHHQNQLQLLIALQNKWVHSFSSSTQFLNSQPQPEVGISVGMEFFSFNHQNWIDSFLRNEIPESVFLKNINWTDNFNFYRDLVFLPTKANGWTFGTNAPRELTTKIRKFGLNSLNEDEKKLLPPDFTLGNDLYFERLSNYMLESGHATSENIKRYFEAQSLWDDSMAWSIKKYLDEHPQQIIVIIVGDFHVIFGGGLPDRLQKRGVRELKVVSQVHLETQLGTNHSDSISLFGSALDIPDDPRVPDPKYGLRADFLWTD